MFPDNDKPDRDMDSVFRALAHEARRRMLDVVKENPGITVGALAAEFDVTRIAVIKHLRVLEDAALILSEKDGRMRRLYFNAAPIQMIHDRWTTEYSAYWAGQMTRIKYLAEARASNTNDTVTRDAATRDTVTTETVRKRGGTSR